MTRWHRKEHKYASTLSLTSGLDGGGWLMPRPSSFTAPTGNDPVHTVQEVGWTPGPVWMGAEYFAPTGTRSPDRSARSETKLVYTVKMYYEITVCLLHLSLEIIIYVNSLSRFTFFRRVRKITKSDY